MRYKVMGHSQETGQKMVLEVEALSKGDAEKKARGQRLNITHIEEAGGDDAALRGAGWKVTKVRRRPKLWMWLMVLIVVVGGIYLVWPYLKAYF